MDVGRAMMAAFREQRERDEDEIFPLFVLVDVQELTPGRRVGKVVRVRG